MYIQSSHDKPLICMGYSCLTLADYRSGDCPAGMVYQGCGSACATSCDNLGMSIVCAAVCVEGCFCPDGLVEYRDRCVDPLECPTLLAGEFNKCGVVGNFHLHICNRTGNFCLHKFSFNNFSI